MNRLVLIGNGFDLAHGLKTSYADFIYWFWKQRISNLYDEQGNISSDNLSKLTKLDGDPWKVFVFYHSFYLKNSDGKDIFNYLKSNPQEFRIENTPFFERILTSIETKGWVDIEKEYYFQLVSLQSQENGSYSNLNKQLELLRDKLIQYLKIEETHETSILKDIKDRIYRPILKKEISVAINKFAEKSLPDTINPSSVMLLNFNYTKTPELYLEGSKNAKINYIHGKLDDLQNVIFGYGDELDDWFQKLKDAENHECLRHIKSMHYLESDSYRKFLEFIESDAYQVVIMGHSCGNSDRTLLNTVFEHDNCVSIKPYYYIMPDGSDNYLDLIQNISRNFTNMKLMRDRVVNKTYCEPLVTQSRIV